MAVLAANQGSTTASWRHGLGWSLVAPDPTAFAFRVFFLGAVIVAGIYGAATVSRLILLVQGLRAALGLAAVLLS